MLFSQRLGLTPITNPLQVGYADKRLRVRLWNAYNMEFLASRYSMTSRGVGDLVKLWHDYFGYDIDAIDTYVSSYAMHIREQFLNEQEWYLIYDMIQYTLDNLVNLGNRTRFAKEANRILEEENAGYRIVGGIIQPITNEEETAAIEKALSVDNKFKATKEHLKAAIRLMSDRENPDYRNSVKESISAVESHVRVLTGNEATLGQAIKALDKSMPLHPALRDAISKLYGYAGDEEGVRHSMVEGSKVEMAEAQFVLVICSGIVNYLTMRHAIKQHSS